MWRYGLAALCGAVVAAVGLAVWFIWYFTRNGGPYR